MTKNIPTQSSTMMSRDMSANPLSGCQSDYLHMQVFVLLIFVDSCYVGSCGCSIADAVREAKRETVQPLKSMHWQKEEGCCHRNHCIQAHEEKPEWKSFFLFSVLTPSPSISPSRPPISPSLSSLSSHTTAYSPHTQEKTEISIHVLPHSLATLTNGSMQLACTHSKRPFEYSSANSCIHWYLKCSGSARALNPRYIWLNLKKGTKRDIGDKDQDSFYCASASNTKWQTQIVLCLRLFCSLQMKAWTLSVITVTYW